LWSLILERISLNFWLHWKFSRPTYLLWSTKLSLSFSPGNLLIVTGILKLKIVRFFWLNLIFTSPPSEFALVLLNASPMPMLLSFTAIKFCFNLSSKKGTNSIFCLSELMPRPVSMTSVSRISRFGLRDFEGRTVKMTRMSPMNSLYFTAF